jgi:orotate phosphoribosyltransferase
VNPTEVLGVLEERGAIRRGHFLLSSGRHSDVFVQKFRVLERPRLAQTFGEALAERFDGEFDVVASPAVGAIVLGFTTALAGGARLAIAEREGGALEFRRGFTFSPHERVLVVEDVITTGASARGVAELVKRASARPMGIGCLIDRADPARQDIGLHVESLLHLDVDSWDAGECPLCGTGRALEDPGSRRL